MSPTVLRFVVLVVLALIAAVVAWRLQQRRPDPPSAPSYRAPTQIDLVDVGLAELAEPGSTSADDSIRSSPVPNRPIGGVIVFGSVLCSSCEGVWETTQRVSPPTFATKLINVEDDPEVHKRYRIDGVPTLVVVDKEGVVHNAFFGPVTDEALAEVLAGS